MKPIPYTNTEETIIFNEGNCFLPPYFLCVGNFYALRIHSKHMQICAQQVTSTIQKGQLLLKMCTHGHIGIKLYQADDEVQWEKELCLSVLLQYKSLFFVTWTQTFPCLLLNDARTDYRPNFYNHLSTTVLRHFGSLFFLAV